MIPLRVLKCIHVYLIEPLNTDIYPLVSKCQTLLLHLPGTVPFGDFTSNPKNALLKEVKIIAKCVVLEN